MSIDVAPTGQIPPSIAVAHDETGRAIGPGIPVLAFDVGGTDIKAALFDADGRPVAGARTRTPVGGATPAADVVDRLFEVAQRLRADAPTVTPQAAGLIVPGIVDPVRGVGVFASNLGWRDAPLRDLAAERLRLPVAFEHDVRAAGFAEYRLGSSAMPDDLVMLVIGTGVAGAILIDGRPRASGGFAGEIGHSPIGDGPLCACGARGCLETVASAGAIARRYGERTGRRVAGAREVLEYRRLGDADADAVWTEALDALALAIAQLTAVLAPRTVIIGGGLSRAADELFVPLRERVRARLSFHRMPAIIPASLDDRAGMLGAALLAREGSAAAPDA